MESGKKYTIMQVTGSVESVPVPGGIEFALTLKRSQKGRCIVIPSSGIYLGGSELKFCPLLVIVVWYSKTLAYSSFYLVRDD